MRLKASRVEFPDTVVEFDQPEDVARASEGFCPFPTHFQRGDTSFSASREPVGLIPQPDGSVLCPYEKYPGDGGSLWRFEWVEDDEPDPIRVFVNGIEVATARDLQITYPDHELRL